MMVVALAKQLGSKEGFSRTLAFFIRVGEAERGGMRCLLFKLERALMADGPDFARIKPMECF